MKKSLMIVLSLAALAFGSRFIHSQIETKGLALYYKLWSGFTSINLVFDYSLNGNNGTVDGALPAFPGFSFAAGNEISCGSGSTIDNIFATGGTISAWVNITSGGQSNGGRLFDKNSWRFNMNGSKTAMEFHQVRTGTDGTWDVTVTSDEWVHLAVTYDNSLAANNPLVYQNGVSITATETSTPDNDAATSDATDILFVGNNFNDDRAFGGSIDEVLVYSRILTAVEVKNLYEITRWRYQR